jgi:WD40 repeat protein
VLVLEGQSGRVSLSFAGDGAQLIAVGSVGIEVWATPGDERLYSLGPFHQLEMVRTVVRPSAAASSLGPFLFVAAEQPLAVYSVADGEPIGSAAPGPSVREVIASRTGDRVVATEAVLWNARLFGYRCAPNGELHIVWEERTDRAEVPVAFFGTGERFVTTSGGRIIVRDSTTGQQVTEVADPSNPHWCTGASFDGTRFGVGASKLYVWDVATWGKPSAIRSDSGQPFVSFAFHPTCPLLAVIQREQTLVKFLDSVSGNVISKFQWKLGELMSVAFSPDGTLAAASSASGKIVVWDVDE